MRARRAGLREERSAGEAMNPLECGSPKPLSRESREMKPKRYQCLNCSHIYDPAEGDPTQGIPPGTAFEDLPADWSCPDCGALKEDFQPMEE